MAASLITENVIKKGFNAISSHVKFPLKYSRIWIDYDAEADVLYLSFRKPQRAKTTIELDNNILLRKDGTKIVGITIYEVSQN